MQAYAKDPTINQFLRDQEIEVNPENLAKVGKAIGKSGSKTTKIPVDKLAEVAALFSTNGSGPHQEDEPAPSPGKPTHPAHLVYQAWEDTITFVRSDFPVVATWNAKEDPTLRLIKYQTPDGGERVINSRIVALRAARRGGRGLPYFLLSIENEKAGVALVAQFPGAPTMEATCSVCGDLLFPTEAAHRAALRDVLEDILCDRITVERAGFRARHDECNRFQRSVLDPFRDDLASLQGSLAVENADDNTREQKLTELKRRWKSRARHQFNRWWEDPNNSKNILIKLQEMFKKEVA